MHFTPLTRCLHHCIAMRSNYLYKTSTYMRQNFVLSMRRNVQHRIDENKSSILPIASAPQTTHSARESKDARVTATMLERCGGGSLSIQLFNQITICSLRFRILRRFFLFSSFLFFSRSISTEDGIMCTQLHSLGTRATSSSSLFRSFPFILQSNDIYLSIFFSFPDSSF